jgi:uncharacterized protein
MPENGYADLVLPVLLARARLSHTREIRRRLSAAGFDDMPRAGVRVIGRLARGATTVGEVAAYDTSKQAASRLVDSLVMRGYVERTADPDDRRRMNVVLTERGRAAAAEVLAAIDDVDRRFLDAVGPGEARRMRRALAALCALGDGDALPRRREPTAEDAAAGYAEGKICYLELPSDDPERSAAFYRTVFGWGVRARGDGALAFDDGAGAVGGTWVTGVPPESEPRTIVYVMVAEAEATLRAVTAAGGRVVEPVGRHLPEITARIADPYGNVLGIYQERTLSPG